MALPNSPDLWALKEFLQTDERPSAIWRSDHTNPDDSQISHSLVFCNAAFEALRATDGHLHELRKATAHVLEERKGSKEPLSVEIDYEKWSLRRVGASYVVSVSAVAHNKDVEDVRAQSIHGEEAKQDAFGNKASGSPSVQSPNFDWTRYEVAGLSPWVQHVRSFDWASTGLGPMKDWSNTLRSMMILVMSNPMPRLLVWGSGMTFIYNEACSPLFGAKHPDCLGLPVSEVWAEIWTDIRPVIEGAYEGNISQIYRMPLAMVRHGFLEETYWDFAILPVSNSQGVIEGIVDEIVETTTSLFSERRRRSVISVTEKISQAQTLSDLWSSFVEGMRPAVEDIPYAILYSADKTASANSQPGSPRLENHDLRFVHKASLGVDTTCTNFCNSFSLSSCDEEFPASGLARPCAEAIKTREPVLVLAKEDTMPQLLKLSVEGRAFGDQIQSAVITPILAGGDDPLGVLITGLSPRCNFDEEYRLYLDIMTDILTKSASFIVLPDEHRRTQKIADDMNVELSHQLRLITRQAERSEARFSRMAASAPFGMFVFDADERPLHVNEAYLSMMGQTQENFSARSHMTASWREWIHPDDLDRFAAAWDLMRQQQVPVTIEYRLLKPWTPADTVPGQEMGGETWLLANAFPDVSTEGKILSVQGWLTDISHRKFTEKLLSRKLEDALENKRQTENFIDMTSHEMRNPLSAILQSADSIVSSLKTVDTNGADEPTVLPMNLVEDVADAAQTIVLCAQHQKRIVDDILTLSKLDASLLIISPDVSHPPSLVYKALKMYEAEMTRADIHATLILEPSYEQLNIDWIVCDASRLLQVVINLLTNAIKFTQFSDHREITITLGASYEKPTGKHHGVNFIPPRHTRHGHISVAEWGEGEELYLQIAVSDTGRGLDESEMDVLFQRFSQASPKTYGQYGGSGLGLFISRELCELQGGQIGVSSSDGRTTFTFFVKAKRSTPNGPPEKIQRPTLPKFLSTSNSPIVFHRKGSVAVGQDGEAASGPPAMRIPVRTNGAPTNPIKALTTLPTNDITAADLHVLIVEDNLINQKVMSQQLRRAGCTVHIANHGQECLDFLRTTAFCAANIPLSLVLLDLEMPTMDGLTCVREIRQLQTTGSIISHVPVIAVTANARSEQIAIALEAGMDSVVTKPFRIPELVPQMYAVISEVASRKEQG